MSDRFCAHLGRDPYEFTSFSIQCYEQYLRWVLDIGGIQKHDSIRTNWNYIRMLYRHHCGWKISWRTNLQGQLSYPWCSWWSGWSDIVYWWCFVARISTAIGEKIQVRHERRGLKMCSSDLVRSSLELWTSSFISETLGSCDRPSRHDHRVCDKTRNREYDEQ